MPIALTVILAVLALLLLALFLSVRFVVEYRDTVVLKLKILCFSRMLYPKNEKHVHEKKYTPRAIARRKQKALRKSERKARRAKKRAAKRKAPTGKGKRKQTTGLRENVVLVRTLVAALLRKTGKRLHLKVARVHIRVATGDAATTAILFGAVSASFSYLLAFIDRITDLRSGEKSMSVVADYLSDRSGADVKLVFSMRLWEGLALLFHAALVVVGQRHRRKKRKIAPNKTI